MGFLTTIVIHNDALGAFEKDPMLFGQTILDGINQANNIHRETDMGFNGYANYISVHPSRHADDETVYLHSGNTVVNLNKYDKDFEELVAINPSLANDFVQRAQRILTNSKQCIKPKKK
jgi:hypothetical protein